MARYPTFRRMRGILRPGVVRGHAEVEPIVFLMLHVLVQKSVLLVQNYLRLVLQSKMS